MRLGFSLVLTGLVIASPFTARGANDKLDPDPKPISTLSKLGIDFGAAELGRFAKLGLSEDQKREVLKVMRHQKPQIDELCGKMTVALKMKESGLEDKQAKEAELVKIVAAFRKVQTDIMTGLHGIVTPEQMTKLKAIKTKEKQAKSKSKPEPKPEAGNQKPKTAKAD